MKKCSVCKKPFTEFEVAFHRAAESPAPVSDQCWHCSKAEDTFAPAHLDHPSHAREIKFCLIGLAISFLLFLPLIPFLDESSLSFLQEAYLTLVTVVYIGLGFITARSILHRFKNRKQSNLFLDPPEQRYATYVGSDKTQYVSKERYDGAIVTEKVTISGDETIDRWKWNGPSSTSDSLIDRASAAYSNALTPVIIITFNCSAYLLLGITFAVWGIPYALIASARDRAAKEERKKIPQKLCKAYSLGRSQSTESPLTYHDKVGFLISKTQRPATPAKQTNSFLANYTNEIPQAEISRPFFYNRRNKIPFMIVDYRQEKSRGYGVSFILIKSRTGEILKKMVVGNEFVDADPRNWVADWKENGASPKTVESIQWYEDKFNSILNSSDKSREILG